MPYFSDALSDALNQGFLNPLGGGAFQLDPKVTYDKIERLYEKAKRDQWNFAEAFGESPETGNGHPELSPGELQAVCRLFSQLYYGERGAQVISAQCATMAPHNEAAKFLSTQVMDEARHVEAFERMLLEYDRIYPMNPFLNLLLTDIARTKRWEEKIIGMNMLVEGLALSGFQQMVEVFSRHPKLKDNPRYRNLIDPLNLIIKDEARHVGFAMLYLPHELGNGLTKRRKLEIQARQAHWILLLYLSLKFHEDEWTAMGIDFMKVLKKILVDHQKRTDEMGVDVLVNARFLERALPRIDAATNVLMKLGRGALESGALERAVQAAARLFAPGLNGRTFARGGR